MKLLLIGKTKMKKFILLTYFMASILTFLKSQPVSQTFDNTTTTNITTNYVIPAGYTATIEVEVWGGGGGSNGGATGGRSGGGGGGYAKKSYLNLPANSYTVIVGGQAAGGSGTFGGTSSFTATSTVSATGGVSGLAATGGAGGAGSGGDTNRTGGSGGLRVLNQAGGGGGGAGGQAGDGSTGGSASGGTGGTGGTGGSIGTGSSAGANGGTGGDINLPGIDGVAPGGGAGGNGNGSGATRIGGGGRVVVTVISSALPVKLIDFDVALASKNVNISWKTATEINNDYFTIEKSLDGIQFAPLANIPGNGSTTKMHDYSYIDDRPIDGIAYYRLKQTDFDGTFTYSDIKPITYIENRSLIKNMPDTRTIKFESGGEKNKIVIFDLMGRPVKQFENLTSSQYLSIDDLKGLYVAILYSDNKIVQMLKLFISNQ